MGRKIQRILSLALALFMVLGLIPTNVFATSSWEKEKGYLDIQDGEITNAELFDRFVELFGEGPAPAVSLGGGDFWYHNEEKFTPGIQGTQVKGTTDDVELSHDVMYYAKRCSGSSGSLVKVPTYTDPVSFTVRHYYVITAGENVTVSAGKVYKGESVTVTAAHKDGFNAVLKSDSGEIVNAETHTYSPTKSETWTVEYQEASKPTYNVTLTTVGGEFGTASLSASGEQYENTEVTLTAAPSANGYIADVSITGAELSLSDFDANRGKTGTFTVGTSEITVTVTFAEKKLGSNPSTEEAPLEVGFNSKKGVAAQVKGNGTVDGEKCLEELIFEAVVNADASLPEGLTYDMLTYAYYPVDKIFGSYDDAAIGLTEDKSLYNYFGERGLDAVEKVKLTWPGPQPPWMPTSNWWRAASRQLSLIPSPPWWSSETRLRSTMRFLLLLPQTAIIP